jgi:hypothetical protein
MNEEQVCSLVPIHQLCGCNSTTKVNTAKIKVKHSLFEEGKHDGPNGTVLYTHMAGSCPDQKKSVVVPNRAL